MTFQNQILAGASSAADYEIDYACRFNDDDSAYLTRTPGSAGNRKTWTYSVWMKRNNVYPGSTTEKNLLSAGPSGSGQDQETEFKFYDSIDGGMRLLDYSGLDPADTYAFDVVTDRVFRDVASWTHYVFRYDSTQSTATDRFRVYINGYKITYSSRGGEPTAPAEDHQTALCSNVSHFIGKYSGAAIQYMDGYIAEAHLIDGTSLGPSSFGKTSPVTGQWIPIEYTGGSYGTTGFYLDFADSSDLGKDVSGNGNDWTSSGLAANDQVVDTPTLNYPTWSTLYKTDDLVISNGNLQSTQSGTTQQKNPATQGLPETGKWYFEYVTTTAGSGVCGVVGPAAVQVLDTEPGYESDSWAFNTAAEDAYTNDTATSYGSTAFTNGQVLGIAVDVDAGKIWFAKNNTWYNSGNPAAGSNEIYSGLSSYLPLIPAVREWSSSVGTINFGQLGFSYTPPSGFKAINSSTLPDPDIVDPSAYFQPTIYTGDGASSLAINQAGSSTFEPDFVWIKNRDTSDAHCLFDSSRGVEKLLSSDAVTAESTDTDTLKTFDSDGFTVGADVKVNTNTEDYIAWQWLEGATPGFDVGLGTGSGGQTAVAHSLGVVPNLIIWKSREGASNWFVWSDTFSDLNDHTLFLNTTAATVTSGYGSLYGTQTSSQTSILTSGVTDGIDTGEDFVVYAFAAVEGFSSFGTYTGNGNANGAMVYTGFKPRFVICKAVSRTEEWSMRDSARSGGHFGSVPGTGGDNPTGGNGLQWNIAANSNAAGEDNVTGSRLTDFLSNGFKIRSTNTAVNENDATYLYMAWARSPIKYATSR